MSTIVAISPAETSLEVTWSDGMVTRFPWIWLRDHAHDAATLHPVTQQRQVFTAGLPRNLRALESVFDGDDLVITWDVLEPESRLPVAFLEKYRHPRVARATVDVPVTLWNGTTLAVPTVAHADVMRADAGVAQWLGRTLQYGVCVVAGTPTTPSATEELMRRVGYVRQTVFGGFLDGGGDLIAADSMVDLRSHTVGAYSHDAPGFQLLHCLEFGGAGGETTLVDGFAIARRLEAESPDAFELLSTVAVPGQHLGDGAHLMAARPVFRHDHTGRLVQVTFSNYDRAPFLLEEHDMVAFYDAIRLFEEIANEPSMQWRHVLAPGEALLIDNWRVLQGRAGYTGRRRVCGGFLNREDVESRLRQMLLPAVRAV